MKGINFNCGCSTTECMFTNKVISLHFCSKHFHFLDDNLSLKQLRDVMLGIDRSDIKECACCGK